MKKVIIVVGLVVAGAVGWFLLSPLFIDETVDEPFPTFPTRAEVEAMSPEERAAARDKVLKAAAGMPGKTMDEAMDGPDVPTLLRAGRFRDVDAIHKKIIKKTEEMIRTRLLEDKK